MPLKIVRFAAGLFLLAALFYFRLIDLDTLHQALAHPVMLALTAVLCMVAIPIAGLRWHLLLRSQGLRLHLGHTIRIVAMAAFFATFLPGGAGGDIVRGVYIYQASDGRQTSALLSIFIDRLIGLAAFLLVGLVATLTRPWQTYSVFEYGVIALATLFLMAIVVLFSFGHWLAQIVSRLFHGRANRIVRIIDEAGEALHQYSRAWRSVGLCMGVSMAIVGLLAAAIIVIATTMQFGGLSMAEYGIAGIYAMIANSLPFTPGGLGIGEGAFASACVALEPAVSGIAYGTIFLVFRCVTVISALPGLIVYLIYPHRAALLASVDLKP